MQMRVQGQGTHQTGVRIRLECTMLTTPGIAVTIALSCLTSPAVDRPCLPHDNPGYVPQESALVTSGN